MARHAGVTESHVVNVNKWLTMHYLHSICHIWRCYSQREYPFIHFLVFCYSLKTGSVAYLAILGRVKIKLFKSKARIWFICFWMELSVLRYVER